MNQAYLYFLPAAAPALYAVLALLFYRQPARWPLWLAAAPLAASLLSIALLVAQGQGQSPLLGVVGIGLSVRLDALGATLLLLVTFLGLAVLQYSRQYLAGDSRHGEFMRDMALTLAAVTTLLIAGNLYLMIGAWVGMSLLLNRLLVFRRERPRAVLAARKKFILARIGDASLLIAFGVLIAAFGTADITALLAHISAGEQTGALGLAAGLIALTAVLKSAQFPTHGWLVEVMETPTPVSALLHAGIVNAGGFLLLRFSDLMTAAPTISLTVAALGGTTAIIGTAIMMTQSNIKSALAYSTVGQMGFMMLQCGLGAYSAAMVHLVGHSLYKAHAFLTSGDAVRRQHAEGWRRGTRATPLAAGLPLLGLILACYLGFAAMLGYDWLQDAVVLSLGLVLMLGLWLYLDAPQPGFKAGMRLVTSVAGTALAYLGLQRAAALLYADLFAQAAMPTLVTAAILAVVVIGCLVIALLQGRPLQAKAWQQLRVHLAQGLYINILVNRWLGAFRAGRASFD